MRKEQRPATDKGMSSIRQNGTLVADNERYTIYDLHINELTVSETELKPKQETRGHKHTEASEVYFFVEGRGKMKVGEQEYDVSKGSVMLVSRGEFHKVINPQSRKLVFITVFEGTRAAKKYDYNH